MKKLLTLCLLAVTLCVSAQQKKVAVYVTGQESGINKVLGDQLVAAFAKSGKYIAIERTSSFLAELGKEQNYQRTGAVDDNELSRIGKQFGVQLVCVADISNVFGEKYVSTRLIDVESAEVINTSNANSKLDNMQELLKVAEGLAKELTAKTVQEKAEEAAAKQKANEQKEKELLRTLNLGYIKCGNLYAIVSYSNTVWRDAKKSAIACKVGNFFDWRIPTITELDVVKKSIKQYQNEIDMYPNAKEQLLNICINNCFWIDNGRWVDKAGYSKTNESPSYTRSFLLLVRDAE